MSLLDDWKSKAAISRLGEEQAYAIVVQEMEEGIRRDGLWGKALANTQGAGYVYWLRFMGTDGIPTAWHSANGTLVRGLFSS